MHVTLIPDPSAAAEHTVDGTGEANGEAAEHTRQCLAVIGFGDEVDVVLLH